MGGMQALQWGVSHPDFMASLVALVPLARTPAWSVVVMEASRKAIMLGPGVEWRQLHAPPANGIRLWRDILGFLARAGARDVPLPVPQSQADVLPWLKAQEDAQIELFDANDWIYQTWAYDAHDVGTTPGMNGDYVKALRAIKAKTLILAGSRTCSTRSGSRWRPSRYIRDVRYVAINDRRPMGHLSGAGASAPENELQNAEIAKFLASIPSGTSAPR